METKRKLNEKQQHKEEVQAQAHAQAHAQEQAQAQLAAAHIEEQNNTNSSTGNSYLDASKHLRPRLSFKHIMNNFF